MLTKVRKLLKIKLFTGKFPVFLSQEISRDISSVISWEKSILKIVFNYMCHCLVYLYFIFYALDIIQKFNLALSFLIRIYWEISVNLPGNYWEIPVISRYLPWGNHGKFSVNSRD